MAGVKNNKAKITVFKKGFLNKANALKAVTNRCLFLFVVSEKEEGILGRVKPFVC